MHVVNLHIGVIFEVLAQLGDIDIHGTRIEVVVVYPDGLECQFALQHLVGMLAEEREELALLGGEFGLLITPHEELVLGVEGEGSELVSQRALGLLATYAAQDGLHAEHQFVHTEGLGDVVVSPNLEALEDVFLEVLGGEEHDGDFGIEEPHLTRQLEAILAGHHDIKHTEVVMPLAEGTVALFAIQTEVGLIVLGLQVFAQQHAQALVVLTEENS